MNPYFVLSLGCVLFFHPSFSGAEPVPACGERFGQETFVTQPERDETHNALTYDSSPSQMGSPYFVFCNAKKMNTGFYFFSDLTGIADVFKQAGYSDFQPTREYHFGFKDRARQDILMAITDYPNSYSSHTLYSELFFFPRKVLPAILWPAPDSNETTFKVILPTEEEVIFDLERKRIVGGVLKEDAPLDLNPDRFSRKFAQISYHGTGLYLRVDKRGGETRDHTMATVYQGSRHCKISADKIFNQNPSGSFVFLFPTDEGFNLFLQKNCRMSFL